MGIFLLTCSNGMLSNNTCSNNYNGIYLYRSSDNALNNNTCSMNENGIYLDSSSDSNTICNNTCSFNEYDGMRLYSSSNNTISNNICSVSVNNGIMLWTSSNNTIRNNTCSNNNAGIYLYYSGGNTISNNICSNNHYGIDLYQSSDNTLNNNICSGDWDGISLCSSHGNTVSNNTCSSNSNGGIFANQYSHNNRIWNNTLNGNAIQAYDEATNNNWTSPSGYGNWWSDWTTPDADLNGIVDLPYNISGPADAKDYGPRVGPTADPICAPTVTITSPTSNPTMTTGWHMIYLMGTATDNIKVTSVTWSNSLGGSGIAYLTPQYGGASVTWQSRGNVLLYNGDNVITVTAYDADGNSATDTLTVTYNAPESIPPTVTITDPTSSPTMLTSWHYIKLMGTATDNIKVTSVTWTNSLGGSGVAYMNPQYGGASVNWQSRGQVHLLPGDNVITVTATDSNGNTAMDTLMVTYTGP